MKRGGSSPPSGTFSAATNGTFSAAIDTYDPFIADAGTYQFDETTLRTRNVIAKVPNVMTAQIEHQYQLRGDSLMLTFSGAWAPPDGEITYHLVRRAAGR